MGDSLTPGPYPGGSRQERGERWPEAGQGGEAMIRQFEFDRDYQAALQLWRSAGPGVNVSRSDSPEGIQKKLERDPDLFLVAEAAGGLIGTVIGGYDGRRGLVYHLAVSPEHRRNGVGTALMTELELRLRAKGCYKYLLLVQHDNPEAIDFYRRLGWEEMPVHVLGKVIG
jgi:ribosomal protein S18 acetylase RimI-like enzyme